MKKGISAENAKYFENDSLLGATGTVAEKQAKASNASIKDRVVQLAYKNASSIIQNKINTAKDDVQPNYYSNAYKGDTRENKKWSGVTTVFPTDRDGKTSKQFKTFCTAVEHSNTGFKMVRRRLIKENNLVER